MIYRIWTCLNINSFDYKVIFICICRSFNFYSNTYIYVFIFESMEKKLKLISRFPHTFQLA